MARGGFWRGLRLTVALMATFLVGAATALTYVYLHPVRVLCLFQMDSPFKPLGT